MASTTCRTGDYANVGGDLYNRGQYQDEQARLKREQISDPNFETAFDKLPDCDYEPEDPNPPEDDGLGM